MLTTSIIAVLPFVIVGIIVMLIGFSILFSSKSTSNWPIAEGTIVSSEVKFETQSSGDNTEIMRCYPQINYEYSVDNKVLNSSTVTEDANSFDRLTAQELVDAYKTGDKIEVFYNPKNPETAVLETSSSILGYLIICLGFCITIFALIKLILHFV